VKQRFPALDIFRGGTVLLMILVNNPGHWNTIYAPLEHAAWNGCTPTDLVFPFFLFAVGNSLSFSIKSLMDRPFSNLAKKVFKRALLIFAIGLLLSWFPFVQWKNDELVLKSLNNIRIMGVLQRIALAYLFASLIIYFTPPRKLIAITFGLLVAYWFASWLFGRSEDPFSLEGFWGTGIDRSLLGLNHIYKGEGVPFDPEGIVSTTGAVCQVIIGYLAGRKILSSSIDYRLTTHLFLAGIVCLFLGFSWDLFFPINKKIWTSSFVLYSSGIALLITATTIYLTNIQKMRLTFTSVFEAFGKNPLFIFVLSGAIPRLLGLLKIDQQQDGRISKTTPLSWFYHTVIESNISSPYNASLVYAICMVIIYATIAYALDRKKIYIKV
jgi:predicted acyltransferase